MNKTSNTEELIRLKLWLQGCQIACAGVLIILSTPCLFKHSVCEIINTFPEEFIKIKTTFPESSLFYTRGGVDKII